ncbi:MAG: pilus assembly PilX family protein [Gammaproteobacteria bacterium]
MKTLNKKQTGAALIICLMLLTIATMVGLNAVSSTILEEKMAGNIRNKHLSFQSAEAGLRAGELFGAGLTATTLFDGTNGLFPRSEPVHSNYPVWENITDPEWADGTSTGLPKAPQFIIEDFGQACRDNDCCIVRPMPPGCEVPIYRVTARAEGLNNNTITILQSTYKRL